jgi:hypothetical protein
LDGHRQLHLDRPREILQKGDLAALVTELECDEVGMESRWRAVSSTEPGGVGFRMALRVGEEGDGGWRREGREESPEGVKGEDGGSRWVGGGWMDGDGTTGRDTQSAVMASVGCPLARSLARPRLRIPVPKTVSSSAVRPLLSSLLETGIPSDLRTARSSRPIPD